MIKVKNLEFSYEKDKKLIENLNVEIEKGNV